MVRKLCDDGIHYYHEPPYTEEEEMAMYKAFAGGPEGFTILHGRRPAAPLADELPQKSPKPSPEE